MTYASPYTKNADIARRIRAALKFEQLTGTFDPGLRFTVHSHVSRTSDSITVTIDGFGATHAIENEPSGWPVLVSAPAARALCRQVEALMNAHRDERGPRLFLFANVTIDPIRYAHVEAQLLERQGRWTQQERYPQPAPITPPAAPAAPARVRTLHLVRPVID